MKNPGLLNDSIANQDRRCLWGQFEASAKRYRRNLVEKASKTFIRSVYQYILALYSLSIKKTFIVKAKLFWGEDINLEFPEVLSSVIMRYGFFEEDLTRMILEFLKPGMVFCDVGAHFGYFTLLSSLLVGEKGQVHSFEPTPRTFAVLQSNACKKDNVFLNKIALSSKKGRIALNDYGATFSAYNSIYASRLDKYILNLLKPQKYEVETLSLDEYVSNKGIVPNFVKIDAESAEYEILQGMSRVLKEHRPIVSFEVGDKSVAGAPDSRGLIDYLIGKGYLAYECNNGSIIRHSLKSRYAYGNILFLPR